MKRKKGLRHYDHVRAIDREKLQTLRASRFSQPGLAEAAQINVRPVQRLEQGENVERWNAEAIAKVLGKKFDELFISVSSISTTATDLVGIEDSHATKPNTAFVISLDGIILNSVAELIFEQVNESTVQECRSTYQRSLEDFAFALVYGTQIRSRWHPETVASPKHGSVSESGESLIPALPAGFYAFEDLDKDLGNGELLKNADQRKQVVAYCGSLTACMRKPGFEALCREFFARESEIYLGDDASLFREGGESGDYKFGKQYYQHEILQEMPKIVGQSTFNTLMSFLPNNPLRSSGKKPDRYARTALAQFTAQVILTHLTTMYEYEKNSERYRRWRIPYALRAEVTRQHSKSLGQEHLRRIIVRHALLFALREASRSDSKESIINTLSVARDLRPFIEIRGLLEELNLLVIRPDETKENRAKELIGEIHKVKRGNNQQADSFSLTHSSVLRELADESPDEYRIRLYEIFPELKPHDATRNTK